MGADVKSHLLLHFGSGGSPIQIKQEQLVSDKFTNPAVAAASAATAQQDQQQLNISIKNNKVSTVHHVVRSCK